MTTSLRRAAHWHRPMMSRRWPLGDIAEHQGKPALHMHAVLGRRDGSTVGGHLLRGEVWLTLEVVISEVRASLAKRVDQETGPALLAGTTRR
ncbi:DUF296 domain-containing protein [Micromonospora purpureochromogenes]|uniref:PPC domain-containing DNA-binding protein n=1 Tax=Micromonospora purpureochromogenes TaxID=47872 RepID=UPI0033233AA1